LLPFVAFIHILELQVANAFNIVRLFHSRFGSC